MQAKNSKILVADLFILFTRRMQIQQDVNHDKRIKCDECWNYVTVEMLQVRHENAEGSVT